MLICTQSQTNQTKNMARQRQTQGTKSAFAEWLSAARSARGYTQDQLAEAIDKTQEFISVLERDERKPSRKTATDIAKALTLPDSDESTALNLLNQGLQAAGFFPDDYQYPVEREPLHSIIREAGFDEANMSEDELDDLRDDVSSFVKTVLAKRAKKKS